MYKFMVLLILGLLTQFPNSILTSIIKDSPYQLLGCYKDTVDRAILQLEGTDPILDDLYQYRENAVQKCYKAALSLGYTVFAVQDSGQCFSSDTAKDTYKKYGESKE